MNDFQIIYTAALIALTVPAYRAQLFTLLCLWGNLVAMLAACLAMDLGAMDRDEATMAMLMIDLTTGAVLASRPGLPRLVAWAYAVTVPIYFASLAFGVQTGATFAIVYVVAGAQVGVLAIGTFGGPGAGGRRRRHAVSTAYPVRQGNAAVHQEAMADGGGA